MPQIWVLKLIGVAVVALALYGLYWSIDNGGYQRGMSVKQAEWGDSVKGQADKEVAQSSASSTRLEEGDGKQKLVYRTITQTVDRIVSDPAYRNVCFDNYGVCVANAAINGTSADSCKSDDTLRNSDSVK